MDTNKLEILIKQLFSVCYAELDDEAEEDKLYELSSNIINEFGNDLAFEYANKYLHENCKTPESVINFAHLYWCYGWCENSISNPYDFLAYFYYVIDFDTQTYDQSDILDSLAITILPKAGYKHADLYHNTQYMPEKDELLIEAVNKLKNNK